MCPTLETNELKKGKGCTSDKNGLKKAKSKKTHFRNQRFMDFDDSVPKKFKVSKKVNFVKFQESKTLLCVDCDLEDL